MLPQLYDTLAAQGLAGEEISDDDCLRVLTDRTLDLLPLLQAAFVVRREYWGREVTIHILNNAQNGRCPEDCNYCAQAKTSEAEIEDYPLKPDAEILAEAENAYRRGAHRYCLVFSGRGPSDQRVAHLADLIREIKKRWSLEVCVSPGLLDEKKARVLKDAGLDRLNHNLNTSAEKYAEICTTHTYQDRLDTLAAARSVGLDVCSGIITGMGETPAELIALAKTLKRLDAKSIPVNFLVPIDGNVLSTPTGLTPEFCLRILCLFRFVNPTAEIRAAAGREGHLRSLEVMALYPASSLFLDGYLNTRGGDRVRVLRMIQDAGFSLKSDCDLAELLAEAEGAAAEVFSVDGSLKIMKDAQALHPVGTSE